MKVFIITIDIKIGDREQKEVVGVYSSLEQAKACFSDVNLFWLTQMEEENDIVTVNDKWERAYYAESESGDYISNFIIEQHVID